MESSCFVWKNFMNDSKWARLKVGRVWVRSFRLCMVENLQNFVENTQEQWIVRGRMKQINFEMIPLAINVSTRHLNQKRVLTSSEVLIGWRRGTFTSNVNKKQFSGNDARKLRYQSNNHKSKENHWWRLRFWWNSMQIAGPSRGIGKASFQNYSHTGITLFAIVFTVLIVAHVLISPNY